MAIDLTPVVGIVVLMVALVLAMKPIKNLGIMNFIFGLIGILMGMIGIIDDALPYYPWFGVLIVVVSLVCLYRGTVVEVS